MNMQWGIGLFATLGLYAWMLWRGECCGPIWRAQTVAAALSVCQVVGHYADAVTKAEYADFVIYAHAVCGIFDVLVLIHILWGCWVRKWASAAQMAAVGTLLLSLNYRLERAAMDDFFRDPVGADAFVNAFCSCSNIAYVISLGFLYAERVPGAQEV